MGSASSNTWTPSPAARSSPLAAARRWRSFCQCVLDGRLPQLVHDAATHPAFAKLPATPFRVGAHLSVPIVLADGKVYGTLCAFSIQGDDGLTERDLAKLACVARVAAKRIDLRHQRQRDAEMAQWNLEPVANTPRPLRRF